MFTAKSVQSCNQSFYFCLIEMGEQFNINFLSNKVIWLLLFVWSFFFISPSFAHNLPSDSIKSFPSKTESGHSIIGTQLSFNRFEKFHSFTYTYGIKRWEFRAGVGYGLVRTLFQQRFYPMVSTGVSYDLLSSHKWNLGPTISYIFSGYTYNSVAKSKVIYQDILLGLQFYYGQKWQVGTRLMGGWSVEQMFNLPDGGRNGVPNYYGEIGVRYVL